MPYTVPILTSYTFMMSVWFWTRIHNFGYMTYRVFKDMHYPADLEQFNVHTRIYAVFLLIIFLLQIYWTVLLLQMLAHFFKSGTTTDLQQ